MSLRLLLIIIAIVLFILAAFGTSFLGLQLGWVGMAFFAGALVAPGQVG